MVDWEAVSACKSLIVLRVAWVDAAAISGELHETDTLHVTLNL